MGRYIDVDKEIREINEAILEKERAGKADEFTTYCFKVFANALSKAPTADVEEVRHGKYINDPRTRISLYIAECSCCNELTAMGSYCMWCGAKMDKE